LLCRLSVRWNAAPRLVCKMDALIQHIEERLSQKPFCTVFHNMLSQFFPVHDRAREKRHNAIREFAASRGWTVKISDPGIRCTFRRMVPG
jgi:hypothetical protein